MPSRSSLLTGCLPHKHGAYSNFRDVPLSPEFPNLYQRLRAAGYTTSHVGKCHYAPVPYGATRPDETQDYENFRRYYLSLGIDHLDLQDDKQVSVWFRDDYAADLDSAGLLEAYRSAVWNRDYQKVFTFPGAAEWHPDTWVGRKTRQRLHDMSPDGPQFLWASFSGPHFPFDPPEAYLDRVDTNRIHDVEDVTEEFADPRRIHHRSLYGPAPTGIESGVNSHYTPEYWRHLRHHYLANVALIDDQIGEVLSAAEERFGDDVLVVFTTDHGEMLGCHGLWGKSDCFYEDVLNVPFLVRRPGQREGRVDRETLRMLVDVFPTALECAGVSADGSDGHSLLTNTVGHGVVVSEGEGFLCLSDGRHKMVRIARGDKEFLEFFDLRADPYERTNIAGDPDYAKPLAALQQSAMDLLIRDVLV